jgi:hypothetical protein
MALFVHGVGSPLPVQGGGQSVPGGGGGNSPVYLNLVKIRHYLDEGLFMYTWRWVYLRYKIPKR